MRRFIRNGWLLPVYGAMLLVAGCATYYKVTDPQSGKEYYTEEVKSEKGGSVKLKDARTNSEVTLQSSEVKEISKDEYKAGIAAPLSKPAPSGEPK
ncbi:MAG TPA: hypothetical protein VEI74_02735 [Candidatus Methylomirabilis sp.]|nr:hypothetical protein [Candidatus Methylomirabilis sp.]